MDDIVMTLDIVPADKEKWYIRIALNWFAKKYAGGRNSKEIHDEMMNCGNPIIRKILKLKDNVNDEIIDGGDWQKKNISNITEFILWIMLKDTAYRQIFFWALKQILDDKKELMPLVMKYYVEPEDWYVNQWNKSKEITKKQRETGKLSKHDLSVAEKFFVPSIMQERINKELDREAKKRGG